MYILKSGMPLKKYKSLRLQEYDYGQAGAYFVTICVKHRENLFGRIENEMMNLNLPGKIANSDITEIAAHYENVSIGEFVVMPNHVHMVIFIYELNDGRQAVPPTNKDKIYNKHTTTNHKSIRLQDIVSSYKSGVTRKIRKIKEYKDFRWQRYYFDHIVRSENGLEKITDYIKMNPSMWIDDFENEMYLKNLKENERRKKAEKFYNNLFI